VWGFAPMDGRQSEGRPEPPGQTGARAESGQPIPGEEACDPDDQVLPGGGEGCEKGGWAGGPLPVPQDVPIPGHETEGHGTRVHVDAPRTWVLWGGESPEVSSSCACLFPRLSIPRRYAEEGASISIKGMEPTASSVRCAPAFGSGSCPAFGRNATRFWESFAVLLKKRPCAYCGTVSIPRTKGHVIPQALYPVSLPQARRITVPECTDCKALWEDAEPHFRNIMIAIWDPDQIVKDNRYLSMQRSLLQCDGPRRLQDFLDRLVSVDTHTSERQMIYPAKEPWCNLILRRIIRGLCHFHGFGTAIADSRVRCDVMLWSVPEAFQPEFTWHEIAPGFFRYGYARVGDDCLHSFWLIRFSQHIEFFGAIEATESRAVSEQMLPSMGAEAHRKR